MGMSDLLIGYARCSTDNQDLTVQKNALKALGVDDERIYVDHGLTGRNCRVIVFPTIQHRNTPTSQEWPVVLPQESNVLK
jgi:hypothetical protein